MEDIFYCVCGETLEQDAQSRECHIIGIVQDQVRWGFEKPDVVVDDPVCGSGGWTRWSFKVPSNLQNSVISWFYMDTPSKYCSTSEKQWNLEQP